MLHAHRLLSSVHICVLTQITSPRFSYSKHFLVLSNYFLFLIFLTFYFKIRLQGDFLIHSYFREIFSSMFFWSIKELFLWREDLRWRFNLSRKHVEAYFLSIFPIDTLMLKKAYNSDTQSEKLIVNLPGLAILIMLLSAHYALME